MIERAVIEPSIHADDYVSEAESASLGEVAALLSQGRRDEAVARARSLAVAGGARAKLYLAWLYASGEAGEVDNDIAIRWYRESAESGDRVAEYYYGWVVFDIASKEEGVRWILRSAAQDYAPALYWEAMLSARGEGMDLDMKRSDDCLRRAASLGHRMAQVRLTTREIRRRGLWRPLGKLLEVVAVLKWGFSLDIDVKDKNMLEG